METFAYTLLQKFEKIGSFLTASPRVLTMDIKESDEEKVNTYDHGP
jgi:hypothetical protein